MAGTKLSNIAFEKFLILHRERLLAAQYENDEQSASALFIKIVAQADARNDFTENQEKLLNQILLTVKKLGFGKKPAVSRYQQPYKKLRKKLLGLLRQKSKTPFLMSWRQWQASANITPAQEYLVFKTAMTFQLTCGCSNFCRRCNEWALPKVRAHFSFDTVKTILEKMAAAQNKEISLYGASDPLDWVDGDFDITDIITAAKSLSMDYSLLTKVPRGKSRLFKSCIDMHTNISVSLTAKNKKRINAIETKPGQIISKQHDTDDLLIAAGLDEDFQSIKPSITDGYGTEITPDGVYIIIPTFTSALYPFGHQKIPVTRDTDFFPCKKTGRHALLVDYFKPLEGYDNHQKRVCKTTLMPVQAASILLDTGEDALTPPGMRSTKEYFRIFETPARLKRKKMSRAVIKKLKYSTLKSGSYRELAPSEKKQYRKKIHAHLYLCTAEGCRESRLYTLSFFLDAVDQFIEKKPVKTKIIRHLLKNEIIALKPQAGQFKTMDTLITAFESDPFNAFRTSICCLLVSQSLKGLINEFIHRHPSAYDPDTDLFGRRKTKTAAGS